MTASPSSSHDAADPPLLSDAWCVAARHRAGDDRFGERDLIVEHRCVAGGGTLTHHQVFSAGRLVTWARGATAGADLCLRQPLAVNLAMLAGAGGGERLLGATAVVDPVTGHEAPPPPLDEVASSWGDALAEVPTARPFVVAQVLTASPFGTVTTHHRLDRGRPVAAGLGPPPQGATVTVQRRYGDALAERAGTLDLLESLEGGGLSGDFHTMALLLGIYEDDDCVAARRALTTRSCAPLVALGEILSSPAWAAFVSRLRLPALRRPSAPTR